MNLTQKLLEGDRPAFTYALGRITNIGWALEQVCDKYELEYELENLRGFASPGPGQPLDSSS